VGKPTKKTRESLDYHECRDYLEDKYKFKERDYAGHFGPPATNSRIVQAAMEEGRPPYWDFWHFVLEITGIHNGSYFTMSEEWLPMATAWQKEIITLYLDEFADESREVVFYVSW